MRHLPAWGNLRLGALPDGGSQCLGPRQLPLTAICQRLGARGSSSSARLVPAEAGHLLRRSRGGYPFDSSRRVAGLPFSGGRHACLLCLVPCH